MNSAIKFLPLLGATALLAVVQGCSEVKKPVRPNIIFIMSDDHAYQAISAYGGRFAQVAPTPNIDRIAANGMIFNRCLVTNSICWPSRATILTGKYSHLNGFVQNEATSFDGCL